jgi:hypothetical protein
MIVMKEESRDTFKRTIDVLRELYPNIALIHASWLDSKGTGGVNVYQHLSIGKFSEYMNKNKIFLKTNF